MYEAALRKHKLPLLLALAVASMAGTAQAQYAIQPGEPAFSPVHLPNYTPQGIKYSSRTSNNIFKARMSQTDAIVNALGANSFGSVGYVGFYTDSTVDYKLGGVRQSANFHGFGGMLNPYHAIFDEPLPLNTVYRVDTIWVAGFYDRRQSGTTPDTLRLEVNFGTAAQNGGNGSGQPWVRLVFPSLQNRPALGQLWVPSPQHGFAGGLSARAVTVTRLLNVEDTIRNRPDGPYWPFVIPGGLNIPANAFVSATTRFKSGQATTAGQLNFSDDAADTSAWTMGYFRPVAFRENANPALNVFYIDSTGLSMTTLKDGRYNLNGRFWGSPALSQGYLIDFSIEATLTTSVQGLDARVARMGNVYPNPVNAGNSMVLPLELVRNTEVSYTISNYVGQQVAAESLGNMTEGKHRIEIGTAGLNAGIYLLNVQVNGSSQTVRFVVNK
jgi:hypothetical protein